MKSTKTQMLTAFSAGTYQEAIINELNTWHTEKKLERLWSQDATLWTSSDEGDWMGWLDVAIDPNELLRIKTIISDFKSNKIHDMVLIGMGGASLFPTLLVRTFGRITGYPQLHVLDSTCPSQIRRLETSLNLEKTAFIISSKSGRTLESIRLAHYFYNQLRLLFSKSEVNQRFIVITDPGTPLVTEQHYHTLFYGEPSIGGRYSALSNVGMVPLGLMGLSIDEFLAHAKVMRQACLPTGPIDDNPGVVLGVVLGVCALRGKNKVTLIISPDIEALGGWIEQLLAESTGKMGKGLIPLDQEPLGEPSVYQHDRVFVYCRLKTAPQDAQDQAIDALEEAGFVVIRITVPTAMHLGAELFRWEIATDVVGHILGIDPFNQPDVESNKQLSLQLLYQYAHTGRQINLPPPFYSESGMALYTDESNQRIITQNLQGDPSLINYWHAHLRSAGPCDYVALLAFIDMSDEHHTLLQIMRTHLRNHKHIATSLGFGPRYLHATGQAYKGGPNTGVFIQFTADNHPDIPVPNQDYTFGMMIASEADADFTELALRSRRLLRIHLGSDAGVSLRRLVALITGC